MDFDFDFDFDPGIDVPFDVDTQFDVESPFDVDAQFLDSDANGIPDAHEALFISSDGVVPDAVSATIDADGDGLADQFDNDLDGDGVADGPDGPDTDGDGVGDLADPFVDNTGDMRSDHEFIRSMQSLNLYNPFFRQ